MTRLIDLVSAPWAITPLMHSEVLGIYNRHVRGEKIDLDSLAASIGRPLKNEPKGYENRNGVAILPIEGVIAKRMTLLGSISGGTSTSHAAAEFSRAMDDPQIKAVVLSIDSPGGAVDGTQEFASLVASYRGVKPIVSHTDGMMASAAYWIGSAADSVWISGDTTQVGSIGVVATHRDTSGADAADGVKTTEVVSGKYKRIASSTGPLTADGLAYMQAQTDAIYAAFLGDVAKNRGVGVDHAHDVMADGRIFIGRAAIDAGLADGVSTLDALVNRLADGDWQSNGGAAVAAQQPTHEAGDASNQKPTTETNEMDLETIKAQHPEIYGAILGEGAAAERQRIQDVLAKALPGHEALINGMAFDGSTTGPEAAVAVLNAERGARKNHLEAMRADAPAPVAPSAEAVAPQGEAAWEAQWDASAELQAQFNGRKSAFMAFNRAQADGKVKIFKQN